MNLAIKLKKKAHEVLPQIGAVFKFVNLETAPFCSKTAGQRSLWLHSVSAANIN